MSPPQPTALLNALQADRRQTGRFEVRIAVEVRSTDGIPLAAEMTNVSTSGFRIRSPMILPVDTKLMVRWGRQSRHARVAWQRGDEIGCRFVKPLSREQLERAAGI